MSSERTGDGSLSSERTRDGSLSPGKRQETVLCLLEKGRGWVFVFWKKAGNGSLSPGKSRGRFFVPCYVPCMTPFQTGSGSYSCSKSAQFSLTSAVLSQSVQYRHHEDDRPDEDGENDVCDRIPQSIPQLRPIEKHREHNAGNQIIDDVFHGSSSPDKVVVTGELYRKHKSAVVHML